MAVPFQLQSRPMAFKEYEAELQRNLKSGHATEPTYYPALKSLLESLDSSISVLQDPKKTEHGSPDFRLTRKRTIEFPVGWIEAKLPGEDLGKTERSDQLKRCVRLFNTGFRIPDCPGFRWGDEKAKTSCIPANRSVASPAGRLMTRLCILGNVAYDAAVQDALGSQWIRSQEVNVANGWGSSAARTQNRNSW